MKISAIVPWAGSKRRLADEIVRVIGSHQAYFNPACGSLAVEMRKPVVNLNVVNELHGDLVNLARCLKDENTAQRLYAAVSRLLLSEELFDEMAVEFSQCQNEPAPEQPDVDRASRFMFVSWAGRNGLVGTATAQVGFAARFSATGGSPAVRWRSAAESIPEWHSILRSYTISNLDMFDLLEKIHDVATAVIYVDPPYFDKSIRYLHDFSPGDHDRLAEALNRFQNARVVVSYYDDERLADLYPGWSQHRYEMNKAMSHTHPLKKRVTEVLLTNF